MNKNREYIKSCTVGKASLVFHTSFPKSYVSPVNTPFLPALQLSGLLHLLESINRTI